MRVLILGGTGRISTAITRFLADRGDQVVLFNRGQRAVPLPEGVQTICGDRHAPDFVERWRSVPPFDAVIDMICFTPKDAQATIAAFQGRTRQLIFCSTVDVYTKPAPYYPIREDCERNPRPTYTYAADKAACERLFEEAHQRGDLAVTILRPAYTYELTLIHTFRGGFELYARIRSGKPVIVHGDGQSLWCACHRDDVARAFVAAVGNESVLGRAYHLAGAEWMTWNQYMERIAVALDVEPAPLVHIPTDLLAAALPRRALWCRENFQYNNIFDTSDAQRDLDFRYTVPFVEGVRRAYTTIRTQMPHLLRDFEPWYDQIILAWQQWGERFGEAIQALDG